MTSNEKIRVWDPLVRISHWAMVAAFATAYLSVQDSLAMHVMAGYTLAGLVVFRIVWGFIGAEHARFSDFVTSPRGVVAFLREMAALRVHRYIGHNPAGGAMVVALLIALAGTTLSGMKLYAVEERAGPFSWVERASGVSSEADDEDAQDGTVFNAVSWEDLHIYFVNFSLLLVFVHISGVAAVSLILGENLPGAIVTGNKRKELKK